MKNLVINQNLQKLNKINQNLVIKFRNILHEQKWPFKFLHFLKDSPRSSIHSVHSPNFRRSYKHVYRGYPISSLVDRVAANCIVD